MGLHETSTRLIDIRAKFVILNIMLHYDGGNDVEKKSGCGMGCGPVATGPGIISQNVGNYAFSLLKPRINTFFCRLRNELDRKYAPSTICPTCMHVLCTQMHVAAIDRKRVYVNAVQL